MSAFSFRRVPILLTIFICLTAVTATHGHPPDADGNHEPVDSERAGIDHQSQSMVLPTIEGAARPWSDKPVLNDPSRFHFAVMTDRTGGHRPGVWMHAVRNLNLLRPEFVVSVGDLIEGYTNDVARAQQEWSEFLGFINELQMRFFFVAGNHDVTNPMLHDLWRKHFGREWYSFDYKGVHFLCLSSEDPSATLGEEQVKWAEDDLKKHRDARWTFVLLHKPLWVYAERELAAGNPDRTNWTKIAAALGSRPHTVFAGHVHHYVQFERNGSNYYQLATTGGGSQLRGEAYGEFDHVVWVTMEPDGPRIANIRLDGVLAADVVTEESIQEFREFLNDTQLTVKPILIQQGSEIQSATIEVQVTNGFDDAISVDAHVMGLPLKGLSIEPTSANVEVAPHDTKTIVYEFSLRQPLDYEQFRKVALNGTIRSKGKQEMVAELTIPVTIDRRHLCHDLVARVDGSLDEWNGEEETLGKTPTTYGARQQWQGLEDAGFRFRVAHDESRLLIGGVVTDDNVMPDRDRLYLGLDLRDMPSRIRDPRLGAQSYTVQITPDTANPSASLINVQPRSGRLAKPLETEFELTPNADGYTFEVAIPLSLLSDIQGADWQDFQLNVVLRDADAPEDENVYLSWRPTTDSRSNTGFAYFFRSASDADAGPAHAARPANDVSAETKKHSQTHMVEVGRFKAPEAFQAVAVDANHIYAIGNSTIGKYDRRTRELVGRWNSTPDIPLVHLNSGVVIDGKLYCAHSNYPTNPETSSIEIWDTQKLEHVGSHSFGIYEGSLTWIDRRDGNWWAAFAHYTRPGQAKDNRWTTLVRFDKQWRRLNAWTFPEHLLERFQPNSCSGGCWGPDGLLHVTGHDLGEVYRLALPASGSELKHIDTIQIPITGQGIAWDLAGKRLFGIRRPDRQVLEFADQDISE